MDEPINHNMLAEWSQIELHQAYKVSGLNHSAKLARETMTVVLLKLSALNNVLNRVFRMLRLCFTDPYHSKQYRAHFQMEPEQ